MTDIARMGVGELSARLQRRELSAVEVTEAFLHRIREVDGTHSHEGDPGSINAWVRVYEESAGEAAAHADVRLSETAVNREGEAPPLTGVPIGLKDLYGVAGKPVTASSAFFEELPAADCDAWARLSAAGMVLLGHLHTHEFAVGGSTDQVGSPRVVVTPAGTVVKRIEYDSFGNVVSDTDPSFDLPFGFAGGLRDQLTGLDRFGYRDYDPAAGRWTTRDPIFFDGGEGNLYVYGGNDPVGTRDLTGLFELPTWGQVKEFVSSNWGKAGDA